MLGLLVAASGFKVNSLDRARVPCLLYQLLTLGICNNQDQRERERGKYFNVEWVKHAMKTQHFHYIHLVLGSIAKGLMCHSLPLIYHRLTKN